MKKFGVSLTQIFLGGGGVGRASVSPEGPKEPGVSRV